MNINSKIYSSPSLFLMGTKAFSLLLLGISFFANAQIKEEKLILDRKREPEVKRIEKKKTSVATVKNYPPQSKKVEDSLNLRYQIKDVAAVSDFKTSTIERSDISPKFKAENFNNYVRFGMGNYGKILGDANISTTLENNFEVGADVHYLSTTGLKKMYDWESKATEANVAAFLNHYAENGRLNVTADYGLNQLNYYGIYAFPTIVGTDLQQKVNRFGVRGYYEWYNNEIFKNISFKTHFLNDHFSAKENIAQGEINLSSFKSTIKEKIDFRMDMGIGINGQKSSFDLLQRNQSNFTLVDAVPKFSFGYEKALLTLSSHFTFLNSEYENIALAPQSESFKFGWFPKAELQYNADDAFKFYTGVDGGIKLNSYTDILKENPFVVSDQLLLPTKTKYHFYFGLKGDLSQELKYDLSAGFGKMENILFYKANPIFDLNFTQNRSAYNYANVFSATYDNGTVNEVKASLQYFPLQNLMLDTGVNFTKYNLDHHSQIYYKPLVQASLGAQYKMLNEKLLLGFKGIFKTDAYTNSFVLEQNTLDPTKYNITENTNDKVGGFADLNLSAEYKIHKNFSIFAIGNNLLNTNYQNYLGYKVLGAQITGGVKISF